ncbi:hypothetical protein [Streptomyces sp. B6B3]|uniref:hypothetical protein n=1 Tax=Streptomyces sp. B6B3 TaxID=3153570 RepID=UPI00325F92E2
MAVLATALVTVGGVETASAEPCPLVKTETGKWVYHCQDGSDGTNGGDGDGDGSGGEPACDMSTVAGYSPAWCEGENACWANVPSAVYPTPDTWPSEPPTPDSVYIYKKCYGPDGSATYDDWGWYTPQEPSIEELSWDAYGALVAPEFTLAFSPPTESVVFVDTWWWADGAPAGEVIGTAALGVRAVAEPDHMEVDPGDGSGTITCDFVVSESDECTHVYDRASDGYPARARLVYNVHFEQDGNVIEPEGLPATFESPWYETTVPVTEVQANVVR